MRHFSGAQSHTCLLSLLQAGSAEHSPAASPPRSPAVSHFPLFSPPEERRKNSAGQGIFSSSFPRPKLRFPVQLGAGLGLPSPQRGAGLPLGTEQTERDGCCRAAPHPYAAPGGADPGASPPRPGHAPGADGPAPSPRPRPGPSAQGGAVRAANSGGARPQVQRGAPPRAGPGPLSARRGLPPAPRPPAGGAARSPTCSGPGRGDRPGAAPRSRLYPPAPGARPAPRTAGSRRQEAAPAARPRPLSPRRGSAALGHAASSSASPGSPGSPGPSVPKPSGARQSARPTASPSAPILHQVPLRAR